MIENLKVYGVKELLDKEYLTKEEMQHFKIIIELDGEEDYLYFNECEIQIEFALRAEGLTGKEKEEKRIELLKHFKFEDAIEFWVAAMQPVQKNKVSEAEIVVHGTIDSPYYEIKYKMLGSDNYNIGYSSYDLKTVFGNLEEYFEIVKNKEESKQMGRMSKNDYYLNIALAVAKRSTCLEKNYGCVIVKNDEIIATGYNGSARTRTNCCDVERCARSCKIHKPGDYSECEAVHAEQNAMLSASRAEMIGAVMYLAGYERIDDDQYNWKVIENPIPCPICLRMIMNSGIKKVITRGGIVWDC